MKPLNLETIRRVIGGKPLTVLPKEASIDAISTDSRKLPHNAVFLALRGDKFDGHDYLAEVAAAGAIAAIVEARTPSSPDNLPLILVDSTRVALGKLGRHVRQQISGKVIAVAGSNGKTSTKNLIHAALSGKLYGSMSPKSFNNDIGVPYTILAADVQQDYLVLELGTNHPGEIATLTGIGLPDIAVITNCSAEHLEFLGDLHGVRRENACIVQGLDAKGLLVVNGDDAELLDAVGSYSGKRITFGFGEHNDLFAADVVATEDGVRFNLNGSRNEYFVPLLGRHTACNALAAIAVARRLGLSDKEINEHLAVAKGPDMRLQMLQFGGIQVLNDAYNANPASMQAALDTIQSLPTAGRRIAVLGDMRELGATSDRYHREVGTWAAAAKLDVLACVGSQAKLVAESAENCGMASGRIHCFDDSATASKVVPRWLQNGDLVLLKASRGIHLELIATEIAASRQPKQVTPVN